MTTDTVTARPAGKLIIGTRGSALARWQAEHVAARLRAAHPGLEVELLIIVTTGDRFQAGPVLEVGGKAVWVKEIEEALRDGRVDLAVHSLKDVPAALAPGLVLAAIPARADARDAVVSRDGRALRALPAGARVGTSSPRRVCQIRALRPDLVVEVLRGNVDTRLRKIADGVVDAGLLACAGLDRLGYGNRITERLEAADMLPAIGQGALAIETRADDDVTRSLVGALACARATVEVAAERALLAALGGSCRTPLAGYARRGDAGELVVEGLVGTMDGREVLRARHEGRAEEPEAVGRAVADALRAQGAERILAADGEPL